MLWDSGVKGALNSLASKAKSSEFIGSKLSKEGAESGSAGWIAISGLYATG